MAKRETMILTYVFYLFLVLVILAGLYVVTSYSSSSIYNSIFGSMDLKKILVDSSLMDSSDVSMDGTKMEMVDQSIVNCPNVLIRRGNVLLLINTHRPPEDGVNPIIFNHLDEYIHYVKIQRDKNNNHCPILFLQEESNAQGKNVYRVRPGPFSQPSGSPSSDIDVNEINGINDFFKNTPGTAKTFVDKTLNKASPSPFNNETSKTVVSDEIITTGENYIKTPGSVNTPTVSDNNKLTRLENISTEKAMNLPVTSINETTSIPLYQKNNYAFPPPIVKYTEGMTDNDTPGSLPPLTTPPNVPVYPPAIQTQYFNGSLGAYNGPPLDKISANMDVSRNVTPVVDASREDGPYNQGLYPSYDPYGQDVGKYTNVDQIHDSTKVGVKFSDNPMDPNWGGVLYTRQQVMSGKYDDNQVVKPLYGGGASNVMSIPSLMQNGGPPNYVLPTADSNANCSNVVDMKTRSLRGAPESA
jgi:hypothetical protein